MVEQTINRADPMTSEYRLATNYLVAACLLAFVFASSSAAVGAGLRVTGDVNAIRVEASESKISEIFSALGQQYNLQYRTSIPFDATITGTYSGSLRQVLPRVLDGYTYVIKKTETSTGVLVNGKQGVRAIAGATTTNASPAKSLAAQWRKSLDEAAASQTDNSRPTAKPGQ
jgi:hypothetical protein